MGPYQYAVHLMSGPRLPFTAAYFGSIVMTIYFAVGVRIAGYPIHRVAMLTWPEAPFHHPDSIFVHHPTCGAGMVSGQLFPNGKHGLALCGEDRWG